MRILLAIDGTPQSAGAVRLATTLATTARAEVRVLQVLEPLTIYEPPSTPMLAFPGPYLGEERKSAALARLIAILEEAGPVPSGWPVDLEIGPVPLTIVRAAERNGVSLILLGLGGHERMDRWFGGETALRVIQLSHLPVLAVPESDGDRPSVVLAAVDFSEFCRDAITTALTIAAPGTKLHLAHAVWRQSPDLADFDEAWFGRLRQQARERLEVWTTELHGMVANADITMHHLEGDPSDALLELAEEIGAELIAAGSHGLGFFGRLMMGSVSSRLVRGARCPVLIAPPRERARELDSTESTQGSID
jgi:nucleotide-binding universal stress UspA family protein